MSIAGYDPSAGAGVTADIKTFEQHGVYGFGVVTGLTWQNDTSFMRVEWQTVQNIIDQVALLLARFPITWIKIGLVGDITVLHEVIGYLYRAIPQPKIILDPVLKASAGFTFHDTAPEEFKTLMPKLFCITPNMPEAEQLFGKENLSSKLAESCDPCGIYLKGGHAASNIVTDTLLYKGIIKTFRNPRLPFGEKHGSGCVLSAALTAQLANGHDITTAAALANAYTNRFLNSNSTRLGYHSNISAL